MKYLTETERTPRPEKVASKDPARPVLTRIHLNANKKGTEGVLEVTDSYKLAVIPVEAEEGEKLRSGYLHQDAFKEAAKAKRPPRLTDDGGAVVDRKDGTIVALAFESEKMLGKFPTVSQLAPEEDSLSSFRVAINARYLADLAEALGEEQVLLEFVGSGGDVEWDGKPYRLPTNVRAIRVRPVRSGGGEGAIADGPWGLIMPIRVRS